MSLGGNPLGADGMTSSFGPSLSSAMRMVDRIHGRPADVGTTAEPAGPACLADLNVLVVQVADLTDCRSAFQMDLPDL